MGSLWVYRCKISCVMRVSCIYVRAWWGRKGEKLKNHMVFKTFMKGQSGHEDARESLQLSEPSNFLVTLEPLSGHFGHLRVPLGHLMITFGSLWGYFGCNRVDFEKHSFSQ